MRRRIGSLLIGWLCILVGIWFGSLGNVIADDSSRIPVVPADSHGKPADLPLPSKTSIEEYETRLFEFLNQRRYITLGWRRDKGVRDTGPYIDQHYYGTHPAVRIFYSPEMIVWLENGRSGVIPDGAMMIKEQYESPAVRHHGKDDDELWEAMRAWTIMVKDSQGSYDGWFWSNPAKNQTTEDNHEYNFPHPISGFGHYCLRCHASTESPGEIKEYTFASLTNIAGYGGHPLRFRVDDSWRRPRLIPLSLEAPGGTHPRCTANPETTMCEPVLSRPFLQVFPQIAERPRTEVFKLPPVTHDWVVRAPRHKVHLQGFVTSNQCMSCHSGLSGEFGPTMVHHTSEHRDYGHPAHDYSPYGEWRWTPMGLAGRDPIFFAQLETELAILKKEMASDPDQCKEISESLVHTCLRCHGAMGHRQWTLDHGETGPPFTLDHLHATARRTELPEESQAHYGALARDGISCTICHRMQPRLQPENDPRPPLQYFLETSITGNFVVGPPNEIYGPFKDDEISPYVMDHAIGFTPKHSEFIRSSQLCGTCHTISLPIVDRPFLEGEETNELVAADPIPQFRKFHHHVEQATYLEWLNSEYENEYDTTNPRAKSCQDCHMSRDLHNPDRGIALDGLPSRIAIIQDNTYPHAENLAHADELHVRIREEGFARHNFAGLNVFLLEMFHQFDDVLGTRKEDFMTGIEQIPDAIASQLRIAREQTATVDVQAVWQNDGTLEAQVTIQNKTGHRFPSGVSFRRAFLELAVLDNSKKGDDAIVWISGRTNELGILVDALGDPLPTEFFTPHPTTGRPAFQRHHQLITSPEQVQIYEVLLHNEQDEITTSFVHGCHTIKDNRLLPVGWQRDGRNPALTGYFLKATYPGPDAITDPQYTDGSGSDQIVYRVTLPANIDPSRLSVRATLYYQSIPPYFLHTLFTTSPDGPATQRLHYICSNIKLEGTPIEGWKLRVTSDETRPVPTHKP